MKIIKFRIKNYKSIVDSGDCYPANGVTVFAGKNEAGKTSILEALEDFNVNKKIRSKAKPIQDDTLEPEITITFHIPKKEIEAILKETGHTASLKEEEIELILQKRYPQKFAYANDILSKLGLDESKAKEHKQTTSEQFEKLKKIYSDNTALLNVVAFPTTPLSDLGTLRTELSNFSTQSQEQLKSLPESQGKEFQDILTKFLDISQKSINFNAAQTKFWEVLKEHIPNFILFSSFDDIFPNELPLAALEEDKWIKDLQIISDMDVAVIKSTDERKKQTHKKHLNIQVNADFEKFWEQDLSKLVIDWNSEKLMFWIEEDEHYYEPEIRSQGRRWHLAFYVRVSARASEDKRNVILIDEPGLYLHAKAQRDILKKLEEASQEATIMFSTHSPYLLESDKLDRIRLVYKKDTASGTIVENKIHKISDQETLTPILTAIGLEMNDGITNIDKLDNVVVEGASDWFYLQAFKILLGNSLQVNFIYGGGAGNMPRIGTVLQGWGCNIIYLYDNDKGFKDAEKNIRTEWLTTTPDMLSKIPVTNGSIEDVFSQDDYKNLVIKEPSIIITGDNSDYAKKNRDKVLDSKLFLESVRKGSVQLDTESEKNAKKLIEEISKKLKELK